MEKIAAGIKNAIKQEETDNALVQIVETGNIKLLAKCLANATEKLSGRTKKAIEEAAPREVRDQVLGVVASHQCYCEGNASYKKGEVLSAVAAWRTALQFWPASKPRKKRSAKPPSDALLREAKLQLNLAMGLQKLDQTSQALECATRATVLTQSWPKAWYRRGSIKLKLGDMKGAVLDLKRAKKLDPQNKAVCSLLRTASIDLPRNGLTSLMRACGAGDTEKVMQLLRDGASVSVVGTRILDKDDDGQQTATNSRPTTALCMAIEADDHMSKVLHALLEAKADPNQRPPMGPSPMEVACLVLDPWAVTILIESGADVNCPDPETGWTALNLMARIGCGEVNEQVTGRVDKITEYLFAAKADVNHRGSMGSRCTPLIHAAAAGSICMARALLRGGAPVDDKDDDGDSALMVAVQNGNEALSRELLLAKASVNLACGVDESKTALLSAILGADVGIVRLLAEEFHAEPLLRDCSGTAYVDVAHQLLLQCDCERHRAVLNVIRRSVARRKAEIKRLTRAEFKREKETRPPNKSSISDRERMAEEAERNLLHQLRIEEEEAAASKREPCNAGKGSAASLSKAKRREKRNRRRRMAAAVKTTPLDAEPRDAHSDALWAQAAQHSTRAIQGVALRGGDD